MVFPEILRILTPNPAYRVEFKYQNIASKKLFSQNTEVNLLKYRNTVNPYVPL